MYGAHQAMLEALGFAGLPMKALAGKPLPANLAVAGAGNLEAFTGYYSMDTAPGAFLSIDTTEFRHVMSKDWTIESSAITVTVSMDGNAAVQYPLGDNDSFDGTTLNMPGAGIVLDFTRAYSEGQLVSFSGAIGARIVNGSTCFNPIPLSTFVGDYLDVTTGKPALSIVSESDILFDFGIFGPAPGQMQQLITYSYVPSMFVLQFSNGTDAYTVMLGTSGAYGLVCFILSGTNSRYAMTILPPPTP